MHAPLIWSDHKKRPANLAGLPEAKNFKQSRCSLYGLTFCTSTGEVLVV